MRLSEIVAAIGAKPLHQAETRGDPEIVGLTADSRRAGPGELFFALPGETSDGHAFVEQAARNGAQGAVVSRFVEPSPLAQFLVEDTREALAVAAAEFYHHPSIEFPLVGVTGTNGKTTVAYLVRQILTHEGITCGLLGTVRNILGPAEEEASELTTMQAHEIQLKLRRMLDNGCRAAVMEVSSHGLHQKRSFGLNFEVAVFTNLTPDHLDYHPDMEHYFQAKSLLFSSLGMRARAVIGWDDPYGDRLAAEVKSPLIRYGERENSEVRIVSWKPDLDGAKIVLDVFGRRIESDVSLMGRFNAHNIAAAAGVAAAFGISADSLRNILPRLQTVPGRMDRVEAGQDFRVLVDYAHTPDALEKALAATREHTDGRLISLFGCGGCRYRLKRGAMGRISARLADFTVITSDNPRTEAPGDIIDQIVAGVLEAGAVEGEHFIVEPDRRAAINRSVEMMEAGDALLIAGKGHEDYQILPTGKIHFDDREEARAALNALLEKKRR